MSVAIQASAHGGSAAGCEPPVPHCKASYAQGDFLSVLGLHQDIQDRDCRTGKFYLRSRPFVRMSVHLRLFGPVILR